MLKKFLLLVLFLLLFELFFPTLVNAQIQDLPFNPPSKNHPQYVPDQLIIVYKKGQSPSQLEKKIAQIKTETASLLGRLTFQVQVITGKQKPISFYEQKLSTLETKLKKTGVIKTQSINNPWGTTTSKATFKKGKNLNEAIIELKKNPEVQNVEYNYYRYTSRISSEDLDTVPNKFVIQYKDGSTPVELEEKVEERMRISNTPLGQAKIVAENLGSVIIGEELPEVKLERIEIVSKDVGQLTENPLISGNIETPETLKNTFVVITDGTEGTTETLVKYSALPEVENIRTVGRVYTTKTPNDQHFPQMWNLQKINAPAAWDKTTGSSSIIVAVIDSGVDYNHPDLTGHIINGPNFFRGGNDPMDDCGHGTHVAGTIGALTNNSIGVSGINWDVRILAIKALGPIGQDCGGEDSAVSPSIAFAADNNAKVINMSLGGIGSCPFDTQQAINYARGKGVTVVVAAGNDNADSSTFSPANCSGVITVGATNQQDQRSIWPRGASNHGSIVSIAAPGTSIPSTYLNPRYLSLNGTSMAAPHVAGAAALLLSVSSSLTPDQIKNTLVQNADPISTDKPIGPRLNLEKAINAVSGGNPPASPTPTPTPTPAETNPTPTPSNLTNCTVSDTDLALTSEEQQLITLVNDYRGQNGKGELSPSINLTRAAAWMGNDLIAHGGLSHTDSLGRTPLTRLPNCGHRAGDGAENLGRGNLTAQAAFDAWKNSPGHNSNMLNGSFTLIGVARAGSGTDIVWSQTFGTGVDSPPPTGNPTPSPSATPIPSPGVTVSPNPTTTPTLTPTIIVEQGVRVSIKIPGIGTTVGDNPKPIDIERGVVAQFIGKDGQVNSTNGRVKLENGMFRGVLPAPEVPSGSYQVKVNFSDGRSTLDKLVPGFLTLPANLIVNLPSVTITTGDVNKDNVLDILDYNTILSCIGKCDNTVVDLNDDSKVDAKDLNIFLRQLDNRRGD